MSSATVEPPDIPAGEQFRHRITDLPQRGWERLWLWVSERINPIVVKEVRQSLKSKQFTISFGLTLIAAVSWTLIAISLMVPRIFYMPAGMPLLAGYFCILAAPLMVIVPFGAFLSLTAETEDSTFELLSISALSALQIVHGKMSSACVQILLYLSALAPCIVLTYLLRGVGLYTILLFLAWTVVLSVCETALALLIGAVARTRLLQVGAAVLVLAGLFLGVGLWLTFLLNEGLTRSTEPDSSVLVAIFATFMIIAMIVSLILRAAGAAIDFPSENNSTPLRIRILVCVTLTFFWLLFLTIQVQDEEPIIGFLFGSFIVLMVIGALITGERGIISPRAQRSLPRTFVGRVFLTWLYPGAGLGYVYLVCSYAAIVGSVIATEFFYRNIFRNQTGLSIVVAGYLLLCYLTFYLGLNRLIIMAVPRQLPARMIGSVALLVAMLFLAHLIPLFLVYFANDYRDFPYGWHQAFNIIWTTGEAIDRVSADIGVSMVILTLCAIGVFGLNLVLCTRDVMLVRVALPPRVRQDENVLQSPEPVSTDPFAD